MAAEGVRGGPGTRRGAAVAGLLLAAIGTLGAADNLHFERIGKVGGPPPAVVIALLQDRRGYVWIGSRQGLILFDGYDYTTFQHDPSDPDSITDNTVRTIYEDRDGTLWLGTNTGGLNHFDPATRRFRHYRHDSANPRSLSHDSVYAVLRDRVGRLWVGTQKGLNRLDPQADGFVRIEAGGPQGLVNDYVLSLFQDRAGRLWVGTLGGGLHLWDEQRQRFEVFRVGPPGTGSLCDDRVFTMVEDESGRLWLGTMECLSRMDADRRTFTTIPAQPDDPNGLPAESILALVHGAPGKLWVGTHSGGLAEIDIASGRTRRWRNEAGRQGSLSEDRIVAMLSDRDGALWIGTWGGGLNRVSRASQRLAGPGHVELPVLGESTNDVTAALCDRTGRFWLGTRSGNLFRVEPDAGKYETILEGGSRGIARLLLAFAEDRRGRIWVATNHGLLRIDPDSGESRTWIHDPADPGSLGPGYVTSVLEDRRGRLWVGTGEGGLQRIDDNGAVVERFVHAPDDPWSLSDDYVTAVLEDRRGTLWVGTRSRGINELDPATGRARRYLPDASDPSSLGHHYVTSLFEDSRGRLWAGTAGGGLNRIDRSADGRVRFERVTKQRGLADDDVTAILEDDDGSLWITTRHGLSRFDPERGAFVNLFVSDGLPSAEFENKAVARSRRWLCFGTVRGHVIVPAGTEFEAPRPSPVVVRSFRTAAGELLGGPASEASDSVEIPYGSWLSVEAAVLDYVPELEHRYGYQLADEWVDIGDRREVTFSALQPGTHTLRIRGRNSQGVWSEAAAPLAITVVPPFWMTVPFRVLAIAGLAALALGVHWRRTSVLERRNAKLLALQEQRENARKDLDDAYQRLRRLTIRLEAAKEDERQRIARELHDEMGPSLTAVIIGLQLLAAQRDPDRAARKLDDAIQLVDGMIQRIRDLSLDLRPPFLEELGLVPALSGYLEAVSERTGIAIDVRADHDVGALPAHVPITAFRVVQEGVTNAVRHSGAHRIQVDVRREGPWMDLVVEDDGRGFDVKETMERAASGRALGLLGMKERVSMLYGQVEIDSAPGKGTRIRVRLPLGEAA